jgi:hypothetical protein
MGNQITLESESFKLLGVLKEKKESMQQRHALELAEIDRQIDAVSTTMSLLREMTVASEIAEPEKPSVIPGDLFGKSARAACVEIAKQNDGVLRIMDAKKALLSAGILKSSKNTWTILYTTLQRSKEFEKGDKGTFRLISNPSNESQTRFVVQ